MDESIVRAAFTFEDSPAAAGDQIELVDEDNDQQDEAAAAPPIIYGRPKGSMQAHIRDLKQRTSLAITDAAKQYSNALHAHDKDRLPNGSVQRIIAAAKSKFELADKVVKIGRAHV